MLPVRRTLTHWSTNPQKSPLLFKASISIRLLHPSKCAFRENCMSPVRSSSTSPRGIKRRRVESPSSSSPAHRRQTSNMPPMLVQEVEDEVTSSSTTIQLTPVEETLTRLLLDVAQYIDETPDAAAGQESQIALPQELAKEKLTLRYTGGWVRDKLLGVPSHDIDVAINKMTGYQFGLRMKEYLELPGNLEKYGLESVASNEKQNAKAGTTDKSKTVGGLHKIEANPEKSKHLETTTMRILGLDIDLVNLRKETYSDDSRNPQVEFGTPEEDAMRRDATVNAMFYNLNTKETEDFTGRGHEDMASKMIRTPLEPYQTFKDDPLRVLRLIRFASRLGYTIEPEVLQAMRDAEIKDALRRKISRERVGTELEKSLQGPDPHEALRLIFDLDLYETIFSDPSLGNADHYTPDTKGWQVIIDSLGETIDNEGVLAENLVRDKEEKYLAWQLAAMVPYRDAPQPQAPPGKKPLPPVAVVVAREGFKATNRVADVIGAAVKHQEEISGVVDKLYERKRRPDKEVEGSEDVTRRDVLGMAIRRWGGTWRSQVIYSLMVEISENLEDVDALQRKYTHFLTHLTNLSLLEVYTLKPLLDGKTLAKAIGTPPGPWMKDALDVVMAWQLRHPETTDPAQAVEEVQSHQKKHAGNGELTFDLIRHFLSLTIRPLFLKAGSSSHPSVTAQGRKVQGKALPRKIGVQAMETPGWKGGKEAYVFDVLRWVVGRLRRERVGEVWPLIVPPLLTLVDDWEVQYKILGAEFLMGLLEVVEPELLARTGLGEVFEEAFMGCLGYLPPTSPEDEAVRLLGRVFPALIVLGRVRFDENMPMKATPEENRRLRMKFLDKVLREGIIYGISHCGNHPAVLILLFEQLAVLLDELGIESVKHIQYVLPLLTEILSHPLGTGNLVMLRRATQALQALIRNCWPRMGGYRGEVLKGLTICWLNVQDDGGAAAEELRGELRDTVGLLREAVKEEYDLQADCEVLIQADRRLEGLFSTLV